MNLYLFLKCMPSDLKSLCSLRFGMRSLIFCALICTDTEAESGIVNANDKALKSVFLVEIYTTLMKQIRF